MFGVVESKMSLESLDVSPYGFDDYVDPNGHNGLNEMICEIFMGYSPKQLCVRGGRVSYTALSAQCMERLPHVVFTTMGS